MKKLLLCISVLAFAVTGCSEFEEPIPVKEIDANSAETRSGEQVTFDVLPNPYALDVMQDVYDLYDGTTVLQPTDLYVRFLPQDSLQLNRLEDEYNLDLFEYPLDLDML